MDIFYSNFDWKKNLFENHSREFTEILKALIKKKNIAQKKLAMDLVVDNSIVSRWLHGDRIPDGGTLFLITQALDLSEEDARTLFHVWMYEQLVKNADNYVQASLGSESEEFRKVAQQIVSDYLNNLQTILATKK